MCVDREEEGDVVPIFVVGLLPKIEEEVEKEDEIDDNGISRSTLEEEEEEEGGEGRVREE